nr:MAG TPA: arginine repressor [Caudoviricetes sp.]
MTDTPYNRKIQNFLKEYVNCGADNFYVNGMMKKEAVKKAVRLLIEENVFSSVKDMKLQALKDYNIFLPAWVFELVKENKE